MQMYRVIAALGYALMPLFLLACNEQKATPAAATSLLQTCPGFEQTGKAPLVYGAQCGELKVKENPDDPNSPEIAIAILRLPAISPVAQADPLFLIQGGPGGSSIDMANQLHGFFADVRKNRDLIFVDQRGTGKSNSLHCEKMSLQDANLPDAMQQQKQLEIMRNCAQRYKQSLPFYTTWHAVQDLDAVRVALGYQTINLWGVSYGTRVALEYARRFGDHTRSIVLDAVAPTAIALGKYSARDMLAALTSVSKECMAQADCAAHYGNPLEKAEIVYSRLLAAETAGQPVQVTYQHPRHQQVATHRLTPRAFSMLMFMALYARDTTVLLPEMISRAEQQDYSLLAALLALTAEQAHAMNIAEAMHFGVICNEDWPQISASERQTTAPFFGFNPVEDKGAICDFWPAASLPDDYWQPISSTVPALLLSGKYDPVTPQVWADYAANTLPESTRLLVEGGNHGVSTEGCMPQIIAQFIERASMASVNSDCVAKIKPLPLVLGANEAASSSSSSSSAAAQGAQP
uniref:alpha/beta fold hydrolase n=1 Tax=Cellvibrio fontiphilus TaxID=1815559 RepID=UPI002B4BB5F7|nr:alpha/beta fold hydrolase [Cellvibrio fontiphilus]